MFDLLADCYLCGGVFGAAIGILPSFICVGLVGLPGITAVRIYLHGMDY